MLENFLLLYFFLFTSVGPLFFYWFIFPNTLSLPSASCLYSLFPLQSPLFDRLSLPPTLTKPRLEQISLFEVASAMDLAMSFSIACHRSRHVVLHSSPLILPCRHPQLTTNSKHRPSCHASSEPPKHRPPWRCEIWDGFWDLEMWWVVV